MKPAKGEPACIH